MLFDCVQHHFLLKIFTNTFLEVRNLLLVIGCCKETLVHKQRNMRKKCDEVTSNTKLQTGVAC
jgi:hypothetical protein